MKSIFYGVIMATFAMCTSAFAAAPVDTVLIAKSQAAGIEGVLLGPQRLANNETGLITDDPIDTKLTKRPIFKSHMAEGWNGIVPNM